MAYFNGLEIPGIAASVSIGYEKGRQEIYDKLWDCIQYKKGGGQDYTSRFTLFRGSAFYPKYDIVASSSYVGVQYSMNNAFFDFNNFTNEEPVDLAARLEECGVVLNTSYLYSATWCFWGAKITRLPEIDIRNIGNNPNRLAYMFGNNQNLLKTIDKLIVSEALTSIPATMFNDNIGLENIVIEGVWNATGSFSKCTKLTHDSLMSIINSLKDLSGTDVKRTLTLGSTNRAKLTDEEKAIATNKGWTIA